MSHPRRRRPTRPGQLRQRLRDDIRQSLVDGAAALLARGTHDFSVQALAEEVGCSIGAIYRYFPSKDAVVDAVRADQLRTLLTELVQRDTELHDRLTSTGTSEGVAATARVIGRLRDIHEACLADPPLLSAAHRSMLTPAPPPGDAPPAIALEALRLVHQIADSLDDTTAPGTQVRSSPLGLAAAMTVCVTAVSLAATAGRLQVSQAAWIGQQWALAALRVAGTDAAVVQEAADLAWPVGDPGS